MAGKSKLPRVDSSAPTAMIAPEDYQHLYAAKGKEKVVKKVKKAKEVVGKTADSLAAAPASDAPTALIAPDDYDHIFCAEPTQQKVGDGGKNKNNQRVPSNAKSALSDAVAKIVAKSKIGKSNVGKSTCKPQVSKVKGQSEVKAKAKPVSTVKAGGSSCNASSKPTSKKASSGSSSRKEPSSKVENDGQEEEEAGGGCCSGCSIS